MRHLEWLISFSILFKKCSGNSEIAIPARSLASNKIDVCISFSNFCVSEKLILERLEIKNKTIIKREKIADGIGRIRDVIIGPDGYIYISVSYEGIYKIVPKK